MFFGIFTPVTPLDSAFSPSKMSLSGVMLSSQVGNIFVEGVETPGILSDSIFLSSTVGMDSENKNQQTFFSYYFSVLDSYESLARLNIVERVQASNNALLTLNSYLDQLNFQYKRSVQVIADFSQEASAIESSLLSIQTQISTLHVQIESAFVSRSATSVLRLNHEIEVLRSRHQVLRSRLVFLRAYITQFDSINQFVTLKSQALSLNKQAIVSGVSVTVPQFSESYLESLGILTIQ